MGQLVEEALPHPAIDDRIAAGIEEVDFDYDRLDQLTNMVPGQEIMSIVDRATLPGHLNGPVVHSIITSMTRLDRYFEPNEKQISLLMPHMPQPVSLGLWKASAKNRDLVVDLFSKIGQHTSADAGMVSSNAGTSQLSGHHPSNISQWVQSLDGFIEWIHAFLWFEGSEDLGDFATTMINNFVRFRHVLESKATCSAEDEKLMPQMLPLLIRLVVLCYQVKRLVSLAHLNLSLSLEIQGVYDHLVDRVLSISLATKSIKPLFDHILSPIRLNSQSTRDVSNEVETIFVVHQLSDHHFWDKYLEKLLSRHIEHVDNRPAIRLVYAILINGLVCPIQNSLQEQKSENVSVITPNTAGLTALQNALSDFLKQFSNIELQVGKPKAKTKQTSHLRHLAKLGSFVFRWTFVLFHAFGRSSCDQLIKKLLKHYGDRNMQNFFAANGTAVDTLNPPFLAQQVSASQIVLESGEPDFHIFLKLIALALSFQYADVNDHKALRKLVSRKQSLIFSLLPNNVFNVNEEQSLTYQDLTAMANRYNLFSTMYHYAPRGHRPPITNIQSLVAFDESHQAVCDQVLNCWANISRSLVIQGGSDEEYSALGQWIRKMLLQITEKWRSIPLGHGDVSDEEKQIHQINRKSASVHICKIIQTWVRAIDICVNEQQARLFALEFPLTDICGLMVQSGNQLTPEDVTIEVFNITTAYLKKSPDASKSHLNRELHPILQNLISNIYNCSPRPKDETLRAMMETWYLLASSMVDGKCTFWDSYISPASMSSFDQMGPSDTSRDCNILFLSKALIRPDFLAEIDHLYVFQQWLNGILGASNEVKFETLLTSRLFQVVPSTLDFASLQEKLTETGVDSHHFTKDSLINSRLSITRHIIRQIYQLSVSSNTSTSGMLSKSEGLRLLRGIQNTMRRTWEKLPGKDKPEYTIMINSIVLEMSAYKIPGFELDPFFSSSDLLDQTEKGSAAWGLFTRLFVAGQDITATRISNIAIEGFRSAVESSCAYHNTECLFSTGIELFGATRHDQLDGNDVTSRNTNIPLFFLQTVFPEFISRAFGSNTPVLAQSLPIIDLSKHLMNNIPERVDFDNIEAMQGLSRWISMTLHAVFRTLYHRPCNFDDAFSQDHLLVARLVNLVAYAATAFSLLTESFPESEQIQLLNQHCQTYIYWVYEYVCSGYGIAYQPLDTELQEIYPDSTERAIMGFGLDMPGTESDPFAYEEMGELREKVGDDLLLSARAHWLRSRVDDQSGPVWIYTRAQRDGVVPLQCGFSRHEAKELVKDAVGELGQVMSMLGLSQM
ncbi:hypothetical protein PV10_01746 [Exophiala mesophila]|uniref:Uncharacterized protein n=1 Tax=Exophiala mesophila TaxID=212818 RepID=A0A0D1X819_EXOME|nr:uncharacterized protein PV10_01746 [Exophiala mesophila]KIV98055.1 hypothetical protein PV10_01746 [Exophiala mesophila]